MGKILVVCDTATTVVKTDAGERNVAPGVPFEAEDNAKTRDALARGVLREANANDVAEGEGEGEGEGAEGKARGRRRKADATDA